jgi:MFS family permease
MRWAIALAYLIAASGLALAAPLVSFEVVLVGNLLTAFGVGINWVFATQLLLLLLPNRVRGRVFSMEFAFLTLAYAISAGAGGWLLDAGSLDVGGLFWLMAGLTLLFGAIWIMWAILTRAGPRQSAPAGGAG